MRFGGHSVAALWGQSGQDDTLTPVFVKKWHLSLPQTRILTEMSVFDTVLSPGHSFDDPVNPGSITSRFGNDGCFLGPDKSVKNGIFRDFSKIQKCQKQCVIQRQIALFYKTVNNPLINREWALLSMTSPNPSTNTGELTFPTSRKWENIMILWPKSGKFTKFHDFMTKKWKIHEISRPKCGKWGKMRLNEAKSGPNMAKSGPNVAKCGQMWPSRA